ncbi:hypothetical protein AK88_02872 [Plasmodium fragile]|uniref:Histone RNA hairpin-binding protein RNA-binding domain-containing protein n=1 Tax=Plasmodium fragile TaxID=5857 RepID=A0A0D9QK40_PLAFR|nr:uncharacterized protein AK88_02872 [Plasmodium fragile]KJP87440.1 hypothetical protein AK88_02872 [Plasmodium fragile]
MSTIRWVDLLSSESNLSHSIANEDVVEKAKKKKFPYNQEKDLNSSFLNSYNADLDNSNVGINLKIKNMSLVDKKDKEEKNVLGADKTLDQIPNWRSGNGSGTSLPSEAAKGVITRTGEQESGGKSTEGVTQKDSQNVLSNGDQQTGVLGNVLVEEKNCVSEKVVSPSHGQLNEEGKSTIAKVDSANAASNSNTVLEEANKTEQNCPHEENKPKEENGKKKELLNRVSVQSSGSGQSSVEGKNKESEKGSSVGKKKKNASSISTLNKRNRSNKIKNVSVNKESIQNSYFSRYVVKKGGDSVKAMDGGDNVKAVEGAEESVQGEMSKGTTHKGKKRKDRTLLCENSTASKFNCTLSHDVTVDDNNVPLNPAKKVKSRVKGGAAKGGVMEAVKEGANVVPAPPATTHRDSETKLVAKEDKKSLGIMENMVTPPKSNLPTLNEYKNLSSDNINMEKFKNFDTNFINYLGDIQSHFSDPFVNSNSNRVNSRLKEIAVGKSTKEYKNYVKVVKYEERMDDDPSTPNAYENVTNAKFQAKYNLWRKKLHKFDSIG